MKGLQFLWRPSTFGADGESDVSCLLAVAARLVQDIVQGLVIFGLRENDAKRCIESRDLCDSDRNCDFGWGRAARLFGGLICDAPPAFGTLGGGGGKSSIGAASDERKDAGNSKFGALLDGPLHAVEFEDRKNESDFGGCGG